MPVLCKRMAAKDSCHSNTNSNNTNHYRNNKAILICPRFGGVFLL